MAVRPKGHKEFNLEIPKSVMNVIECNGYNKAYNDKLYVPQIRAAYLVECRFSVIDFQIVYTIYAVSASCKRVPAVTVKRT